MPKTENYRNKTRLGAFYPAGCVIITTGTYLGGKIHIGELNYQSGPDNVSAALQLTESLRNLGLSMRRFKPVLLPEFIKGL